MEIESFIELGMNKNEAKAYKILLEKGKLSSVEVSKFSGVPYGRVYDVLNSLEQKGFIKIIPEKTKKFIPANIKEVGEILSAKEKTLQEIKKELNEIKTLQESREITPVVLGYGKNAFYKTIKEMKEPEKYDYSIKYNSEYRDDWAGKRIARIKKGMDLKVLARYDSDTKENVKKWLKIDKKMKQFENEGVAFSVVDDQEVLITLINANMTLLINDSAFAKIMKKMFLETYKNAEEIK